MLAQLVTALPDRDAALSLARDVIDARLAACVQVIDPITSVYRWEGSVHEEREVLLFMKVPAEGAEALAQRVRAAHPYDTPEIAVTECSYVDDRYLAWARAEVRSAG